jgi:DNA-binding YbaB/EbfC family protein
MAKRGGFPGGMMPGNMSNLMKQAQKMQQKMAELQAALEEKEYTAKAGGGAVEVTVSGKRELTKVTIDPDAVDPDDVEMLQDMIIAAANEALRAAEDDAAKAMGGLTGGLTGGMGGFGF